MLERFILSYMQDFQREKGVPLLTLPNIEKASHALALPPYLEK